MVQLLSAHIVGPTMCVNLTLAFVLQKIARRTYQTKNLSWRLLATKKIFLADGNFSCLENLAHENVPQLLSEKKFKKCLSKTLRFSVSLYFFKDLDDQVF